MKKEFYVVKFGEKYYKKIYTTEGGAIELTLVDDLLEARTYKNLNRDTIQHLLAWGGRVIEVNIWEFDHTFSLEREWEDEN